MAETVSAQRTGIGSFKVAEITCECGCGQLAPIAKSTDPRRGAVKGQPQRYIAGHHLRSLHAKQRRQAHPRWNGGTKVRSDGYILTLDPDHARANRGYVFAHILVAEAALGKPLPEGAVVHHVNEDPADNRPANLVICENHAYHMLLHQRARALRICGHVNWLRCIFCKRYDDPTNLYVQPHRRQARHRACRRRYERIAALKDALLLPDARGRPVSALAPSGSAAR